MLLRIVIPEQCYFTFLIHFMGFIIGIKPYFCASKKADWGFPLRKKK
jgi:hypothetical protein